MRTDHPMKISARNQRTVLITVAVIVTALFAHGCRRSSSPSEPTQQSGTSAPAAANERPTKADTDKANSPDLIASTKPAARTPAQLGKQLYARHCAACHGERG